MKINITLSLDESVVYWLKGQNNYSNVANEALKDQIDADSDTNLQKLSKILEETKQIIKKTRAKERVLKQKIEKVKQKESRILKLYNSVPAKVLQDIQSFKNLTVITLRNRYDAIYKKNYDIKWMDLKKVFEEVKGGGSQ